MKYDKIYRKGKKLDADLSDFVDDKEEEDDDEGV